MQARRLLMLATLAVAGCGGAPEAERRDPPPAPEELAVSAVEWQNTDFTRHSVPLDEFASGGPGRDGIPPIDRPAFVSLAEAGEFLDPREPVLALEVGGEARAYPHQILVWHEVVNDTLGGRPVAVTFCPLCNSSLVFDRRVGERTLTFGTTGNLRRSDLVMWDRQTESWWQQLSGEAVVGRLTGTKLTALDALTLGFADFRRRYPDGEVLSRETGFDRPYGSTPYVGYDKAGEQPFLFEGETDGRLPPKERVLSIADGEQGVVVPFSRLRRDPVAELQAGGVPVVALHAPGVRSSLDAEQIADSRDVGTAAAFDRRLDGRALTFTPTAPGLFRDRQTGSTWDVTGLARGGPLAGRRLSPVRHDVQFWFAVAAFLPDVRIAR